MTDAEIPVVPAELRSLKERGDEAQIEGHCGRRGEDDERMRRGL